MQTCLAQRLLASRREHGITSCGWKRAGRTCGVFLLGRFHNKMNLILWLRVSRATSCAYCLNSWCCVFFIPAAVEGLRVWLVPLHPHRHPAPIRLLAPHHWKPDRHGSRQRYAARQPLHNIYTRFIQDWTLDDVRSSKAPPINSRTKPDCCLHGRLLKALHS